MDINTKKNLFADYAASQVSAIREFPLPRRRLSVFADILRACRDVYNSGIIFQRVGAAANRAGTPHIDEILSALATRIHGYLSTADASAITQADFDAFHDELCTSFLESLNAARREAGFIELYYGSAQKMTNIVFKYLACYSDYSAYADLFKYCHMPIDTVVLKWLKDKYDLPDIKYYEYKGNLSAKYRGCSWTKLGRELYVELVATVRGCISGDPSFAGKTELETEFLIWG